MVYVHLAYGYEEIEALMVVDILRRAGIHVETVSISDDKVVEGAHGIKVCADTTFGEADYDNCQMIVLPGGMPGATNLEAHEGLMDQIKAFANTKKVAAICASPAVVLAPHGILDNRKATAYPGFEDELKNGGAHSVSDGAVVDGNIITGKGPGCATEFALAIVRDLAGNDVADKVAKDFLYVE